MRTTETAYGMSGQMRRYGASMPVLLRHWFRSLRLIAYRSAGQTSEFEYSVPRRKNCWRMVMSRFPRGPLIRASSSPFNAPRSAVRWASYVIRCLTAPAVGGFGNRG
jgi:hypothetical protein